MKSGDQSEKSKGDAQFQMFMVPCSCGTTFAVAKNYDHQGTAWNRYLICPNCGKRHDPKNRLLQVGYHREGVLESGQVLNGMPCNLNHVPH
jgi:hypothetical protein